MSSAPGEIASVRVRHRSFSDAVAERLREMILVGELPPGRRMAQDELAKMLSVSTTPVREALLKLAAQGLIEANPNRSFRVIRTTREDITDTYWLHASLAGELTRRACLNRTDDLIAELRQAEADYSAAVTQGRPEEMERSNWRFHHAINAAANSPRLLFMLRTTLRFIPDGLYPQIPEWGDQSASAHEMIVGAVAAGYADTAAQVAAEHVREAGALLINLLDTRRFWDREEPEGPAA